ncbi:MAG: PA2169 family four-helix-bundle protein [Rudaea sp.]
MNTLESVRTEDIGSLHELVDITRDGVTFYGDAANKIANPQLKSIFVEMTDTRKRFVDALSKELPPAAAKPAPTSDVRGTWHKLYTDIRGKLGDKGLAFTSDVQASEDRLLKAYDSVTHDHEVPATVKSVVANFLPTMRKQYDSIRERKWAAAA